MNVDEFRTHPRLLLDLEEEDLPSVLVDRWVNEGFRRIVHAVQRWPFYETSETVSTVSDTAVYTLGSVDRVRSMHGPRGELQWMDEAAARDKFWMVTTSVPNGFPRAWSEFGDGVRLWPTPDAAYTVTVLGYRKPLTVWQGIAGEEPDLPVQFHDVLMSWVLFRTYLQQDDPQLADVEFRNFSESMTQMTADVLSPSQSFAGMVLHGGNRSVGSPPLPPRQPFSWE